MVPADINDPLLEVPGNTPIRMLRMAIRPHFIFEDKFRIVEISKESGIKRYVIERLYADEKCWFWQGTNLNSGIQGESGNHLVPGDGYEMESGDDAKFIIKEYLKRQEEQEQTRKNKKSVNKKVLGEYNGN